MFDVHNILCCYTVKVKWKKMACLLRYVRALGALYMRLVGTSLDCYKYLEPLYLDYRKLKMLNKLGGE